VQRPSPGADAGGLRDVLSPETLRLLHVVSSALMFGVGVGAFWFMTTAVRSGDLAAIAVTTRNAVRAEWAIAVPVSIVQPTTGYLLMQGLGYRLDSAWFFAVFAAYMVAGIAWVYLVKAEYRLRDLAAGPGLHPGFNGVFARWRWLALVTFAGVLTLFALMVFRPGL
jgi:uncharacterized membrane protein